MPTAAEARNRALKRLMVIGRNQSADSASSADLDQAYLEVYAWLDSLDLATWGPADDIPDEYVNDVVAKMCRYRLDDYGTPEPRRSEIRADADLAEFNISRLQASPKTGTTEIQNY